MRVAGVAAAFAVIGMIASGCAAGPELSPPPPPATDQALPEPTPTPTATPFVPTCLTIISADTIATLEAEGFVLIEEHEDDLRTQYRVEAAFFDHGGVDCLWGIAGGGDSLVAFGYSTITPAAESDVQAQLADSGYVRSEEGGDVVYSIDPADDVMGVGDVFLFSDGAWYHSTTRDALEEIRQNIN